MKTTATSLPRLQLLARSRSAMRAPDFFALMKPRVMFLAVFTAFVGMISAPVPVGPLQASLAMLAIAVGAGASGVLNMWYDADIDAVMTRTARRPIPQDFALGSACVRTGPRLRRGPCTWHGKQCRSRWPACLHDLLLHRRIHALIEPTCAAEHRHRRSCGRTSSRGRLGRRHPRGRR
jgi:UbiA prenyltransferase family